MPSTPWSATTYSYINYSAVTYYFAPTELLYLGNPTLQRNQIVQESESGEVKIQELDANTRELYQFAIIGMPASDRTIVATTVRGFDTLKTLITSTLNYRETLHTLGPSTMTVGQQFTARFWGSSFPPVKLVHFDNTGAERYGDGTDILTFRKEI